jgi:hypothetical protein
MKGHNLIDIAGQKFGRWLAIRHIRDVYWWCRCDCGSEKPVNSNSMRKGLSTSCGCWNRENAPYRKRSHGHATHVKKDPTYQSWRNAKARCFNPANNYYDTYGGRGITMCDDWRDDFTVFLRDMGERPAGTSLDRIDNDRGYEPGNCRWSGTRIQSINKRHIAIHDFEGQRLTLKDIARVKDVNYAAFLYRIKVKRESIDAAVLHLSLHKRRRRNRQVDGDKLPDLLDRDPRTNM